MLSSLEIIDFVQKWSYRPKRWRLFARELLVLIEGIRPVIFLDEVYFSDITILEAFLEEVNQRFGIKLCLLTYSFVTDDNFKQLPPSIFVSRFEFLESTVKLTGLKNPVLVSISSISDANVMDMESRNGVLSKIQVAMDYIASLLKNRRLCWNAIELREYIDVNLLPTFAGVILQYPVVYVLNSSNTLCMNPCMDCTFFRVFPKSKDEIKRMKDMLDECQWFSFSVPSKLVEESVIKDSINGWFTELESKIHQSQYWTNLNVETSAISNTILRF
eukprot:g7035.t1